MAQNNKGGGFNFICMKDCKDMWKVVTVIIKFNSLLKKEMHGRILIAIYQNMHEALVL